MTVQHLPELERQSRGYSSAQRQVLQGLRSDTNLLRTGEGSICSFSLAQPRETGAGAVTLPDAPDDDKRQRDSVICLAQLTVKCSGLSKRPSLSSKPVSGSP